MQQNKINILSTRSLNNALIAEAKEKNIEIDAIDFISTTAIINAAIIDEVKQLASKKATIIFTSTNAIDAVINWVDSKPLQWKCCCIGNATKNAAAQFLGEENILLNTATAKELALAIIEQKNIKEVIFFCGDIRRDELPNTLNNAGVNVHEYVVYETKIIPQKVEKNYNAILFFSPSAVKSFFSCNKIEEQTILFAIGNTTANEIKEWSKNKMVISDKTDKDWLVKKAIETMNSEL